MLPYSGQTIWWCKYPSGLHGLTLKQTQNLYKLVFAFWSSRNSHSSHSLQNRVNSNSKHPWLQQSQSSQLLRFIAYYCWLLPRQALSGSMYWTGLNGEHLLQLAKCNLCSLQNHLQNLMATAMLDMRLIKAGEVLPYFAAIFCLTSHPSPHHIILANWFRQPAEMRRLRKRLSFVCVASGVMRHCNALPCGSWDFLTRFTMFTMFTWPDIQFALSTPYLTPDSSLLFPSHVTSQFIRLAA